ncbi:unnamed protein product [Schistosoma mattheei]|uniref:Uncharacterized protein n=1 Tax=Schistosoma mattheei TaxID=31246 RepID=A0A183PXA4_9TREM|nr:unnamed protein product [Schistosoma mattheei]
MEEKKEETDGEKSDNKENEMTRNEDIIIEGENDKENKMYQSVDNRKPSTTITNTTENKLTEVHHEFNDVTQLLDQLK